MFCYDNIARDTRVRECAIIFNVSRVQFGVACNNAIVASSYAKRTATTQNIWNGSDLIN